MAEERAQPGLPDPMNLQRIFVNHVGSEYDMLLTAEFLWLLAEITAEGANGN